MARLLALSPVAGLGLPLRHGEAVLTAAEVGPAWSVAPFRDGRAAVEAVVGPLPAPGRVVGTAPRVMWWGEGRWLVIGAVDWPEGLPAAVVPQGDGIAAVRLDGAAAADVLARLVPVDVARMEAGEGVRTLLNHMTITLIRDEAGWEIHAMRSMAGTLVHELAEAMRMVAARAGLGA